MPHFAWFALFACGAPEPELEPAPVAAGPRVVFLGDSLTAGLGLPLAHAFPARVGELLATRGIPLEVVNAGVSGDTSAGGLRRVAWILGQNPDVVVLALGANDMMRGLPAEACAANLDSIISQVKDAGTAVLLAGMKADPSLGEEYVRSFDGIYPALAARHDVPLVPFLLEGVAGDPAMNQPDGVHPTAAGQDVIAARIADALAPLVVAAK